MMIPRHQPLIYLSQVAEVPERGMLLVCEACQVYWRG